MIDVGGYKDILDDAANDLTIAADSKRCHSLKTVVDGQTSLPTYTACTPLYSNMVMSP